MMMRTGGRKLWPISQIQSAICFEQPTKNTTIFIIYMLPMSAFMLSWHNVGLGDLQSLNSCYLEL